MTVIGSGSKVGKFLNWLLKILQRGKEKGVFDKKAPIKSGAKKLKTTKADRAGFSAAQIIAEFGITGKIGRALLRKHNVARTPEAIRAFFKSRAK